METMEYNTSRNKLIISEYGRNVQKLVKYCMTIEDRVERTKFAKIIIQIMGQMNPSVRESGDFRHKLWDHMHVISDFQLDVDAPYPLPTKKFQDIKPQQVGYGEHDIKFKMYGANIVKIIEKANEFEEGEEKDALVHAIANHLKKSYLNWNRESVDDELIMDHLNTLSKGKLEMKDDLRLNTTNEILARNKKKKTVTKTPTKGPRKGPVRRKKSY